MPQQEARDWIPVKQIDFSGGVNWIDDPADLDEKEIADARNVRLTTRKTIEQRLGYTQYNSSAIGASTEVRSLFQFKDYSGALIPLAQCSDDKLYKGSTAFPNTGGSWTSILSETASSTPAFMDAMWGTFIYTNGVDVPQVWEGTYGKCQGFRITQDNGATYRDYSIQVSDEDTTTYASVGGLDTLANGDWILIKSRVPKLTGIKVVMYGTDVNDIASILTVHYRSAAGTWTEITTGYSDGTSASSKTLKQSGDVTWTEVTCVPDLIDNSYGYFLRLSVSAALSTTVRIKAIYLYYNTQALPSFWDSKFIKPDGFVKTIDTDVTYVDYTILVTDDALSTVAELDALPTSTGFFYVKSVKKFRAVQVTMSVTNVNTNTSTLSAQYWNGSAWTTLTIVDGTSANSKTLAQSGLITWTWPTAEEMRRVGQDVDPFHVVRFTVSATLSATVEIAEVEIIEYQDVLRPMKGHIFHKNRVFMWGRADAPNYLFYSAQHLPDVWTGDDAGNIGLPSGLPITACARFYNDLMIATDTEIYILQGYTPQTFGLLKINTGGIGVSAPHSCVSVGKMIYFMHATGFYRFDGIGVIYLSKNIQQLFDDTKTSYYIPSSRYEDVQGRFNRVDSCVEWTVSKGSSQTTNNLMVIFDVDHEGWWFDDIVASALLKTESATYQDLWYHGDYTGKVHRDYNGTSDNGTAISAYFATRAQQIPGYVGWLMSCKGLRAKLDVQSAGSLTVTYAASGATSFSSYGTMDMTGSGLSFVVREIYDPIVGTAIEWKFAQSTKDYTFAVSEVETFLTPIRSIGVAV